MTRSLFLFALLWTLAATGPNIYRAFDAACGRHGYADLAPCLTHGGYR